MAAKDHTLTILRDPLSELARKERRFLLATGGLGIVIVEAGILPSKISALGIEFNPTNQKALLIAMACLIAYFLIAFVVYAWSDFLSWRLSITQSALDALHDLSRPLVTDLLQLGRAVVPRNEKEQGLVDKIFEEQMGWMSIWNRLSKPTAMVRGVFEFLLPLVVGLFAVIDIARKSQGL